MHKHGGTILRMSRSAQLEAPSQVGSLLVYRARELTSSGSRAVRLRKRER
jgi:hypothetical protein